jgi:sugar phosphate isomerase/epimerase
MNQIMNRRGFLQSAALLPFAAAAQAQSKKGAASARLRTSLNAYSFNKMLNDNIKKRGPGITLIQVMEFAAKCKFEGFDATGYFMPGYPEVPSDAYLAGFKQRAADLGIAISGTGVRNNFTTADKDTRAEGVAHIKQFVEVAAKLGAPVVRVFADTQMRAENWQSVSKGAARADVQNWIAADLRECADHGKKFNVIVGVQNHGDFLATGEEQLALIKAVGSPFCGPIVDTGYYKTPDPYQDMALVAPTSVNWQVKQSPLGEDSEVPIDLVKMLKIVRHSGYKGFLPIETLSPQGKPYDPFTVVPAFLAQLQAAIAATA